MLKYTYLYLSKSDLNDQKRTKNTLYSYVFIYLVQETDIEEKDAKTKLNEQNRAWTGMIMSNQSRKSQGQQKSTPTKSKSTPKDETETESRS